MKNKEEILSTIIRYADKKVRAAQARIDEEYLKSVKLEKEAQKAISEIEKELEQFEW